MISNTDRYFCKKYGEYCERANMYGNCLSTACKKVTPIVPEINHIMTEIEKFLVNKNIVLSESDKKQLEQLLEDLRQTSYYDGFDSGYSFGYDTGYDFALSVVD